MGWSGRSNLCTAMPCLYSSVICVPALLRKKTSPSSLASVAQALKPVQCETPSLCKPSPFNSLAVFSIRS